MSDTPINNPLHIRLIRGNSNESGAALNVAHNKNMAIIESTVNRLIDVITESEENISVKFEKLTLKAAATDVSGTHFTIVKTVANQKAEFVITPLKTSDMRNAMVQVRDFYNELILTPQKIEESQIKIVIDNVDDIVVTNPSNPDFDTNNLSFLIVQFNNL